MSVIICEIFLHQYRRCKTHMGLHSKVVRCLILRPCTVSKPYNMILDFYGQSEVWQASGRQNSHGSCQLSDRFSDFSTCLLCQHQHPFPGVHVKRVPTSVYEFPAADKDKKGLTAYKLQGSRSWNWRTIMLYYSVWFCDGFWRYPWSRK